MVAESWKITYHLYGWLHNLRYFEESARNLIESFPDSFWNRRSTKETSFLLVWLPGRSFEWVYAYKKRTKHRPPPRPLKMVPCYGSQVAGWYRWNDHTDLETWHLITSQQGLKFWSKPHRKKTQTARFHRNRPPVSKLKKRLILVEILLTARAVIPIPDRWRLTAVQILADVCPSHLITEYEQI